MSWGEWWPADWQWSSPDWQWSPGDWWHDRWRDPASGQWDSPGGCQIFVISGSGATAPHWWRGPASAADDDMSNARAEAAAEHGLPALPSVLLWAAHRCPVPKTSATRSGAWAQRKSARTIPHAQMLQVRDYTQYNIMLLLVGPPTDTYTHTMATPK